MKLEISKHTHTWKKNAHQNETLQLIPPDYETVVPGYGGRVTLTKGEKSTDETVVEQSIPKIQERIMWKF